MKLVDSQTLDWTKFSGHRDSAIQFKKVLQGDPKAKDNFELAIVRAEDSYYTPRHRHNFDQIRYGLSGNWGFDKAKFQKAGEVGYFAEGVYYQQRSTGDGPAETLLVQRGGASGNGFLSFEELAEGYKALLDQGTFNDGIFTWSEDNGSKKNKDGYEAIWEYMRGTKIDYPAPRYDGPVLMNPENFNWTSIAGQKGAFERHLGTFTEKQTQIIFYSLEQSAALKLPAGRNRLFFVLEGDGECQEAGSWHADWAIQFFKDEEPVLIARSDCKIYSVVLPAF